MSGYLRSLFPRLSPPLWLLPVGYFVNAVGTGIALPFLLIYLHYVRGSSSSSPPPV